jgi:hypothetical protein
MPGGDASAAHDRCLFRLRWTSLIGGSRHSRCGGRHPPPSPQTIKTSASVGLISSYQFRPSTALSRHRTEPCRATPGGFSMPLDHPQAKPLARVTRIFQASAFSKFALAAHRCRERPAAHARPCYFPVSSCYWSCYLAAALSVSCLFSDCCVHRSCIFLLFTGERDPPGRPRPECRPCISC